MYVGFETLHPPIKKVMRREKEKDAKKALTIDLFSMRVE
jgi:hypothetical protein